MMSWNHLNPQSVHYRFQYNLLQLPRHKKRGWRRHLPEQKPPPRRGNPKRDRSTTKQQRFARHQCCYSAASLDAELAHEVRRETKIRDNKPPPTIPPPVLNDDAVTRRVDPMRGLPLMKDPGFCNRE